MKTFKSKLFAFAFVALGLTAGVTSCSKDKEEENADFSGTYYGSYKIVVDQVEVYDTITITNKESNNISIYSAQLNQSFNATVNGNKATFEGFQADELKINQFVFNGIEIKSGNGILNNDKELGLTLSGVSVQSAEGDDPL